MAASFSTSLPSSAFPAKAGTQIHHERLEGFTWAPAFAGEMGKFASDQLKGPKC